MDSLLAKFKKYGFDCVNTTTLTSDFTNIDRPYLEATRLIFRWGLRALSL